MANGDNNWLYADTTFELKDVLTQSVNVYRSEISIGTDIYLITLSEKSRALWNPKYIMVYTFRNQICM
jgi:hypothetical protein